MKKETYFKENSQSSGEDNEDFLNNIDFGKVLSVAKKCIPWILLILIFTNAASYLYIRYTKPMYESQSEIKLDVKSEARMLGFSNLPETPNYQNLSGEIELIRSRLFFNKIINVLDLDVTYYTRYGTFLNEERYKTSPFKVTYVLTNEGFYDRPFDVELLDHQTFRLSYGVGDQQVSEEYRYNEKINLNGLVLEISLTHSYDPSANNRYYFVLNSNRALINYIAGNIKVEPINFNANTIRISFQDHNKYKARDLVNAIDTLYLNYTQEEKNKANKQKIDFLDEQLAQTEHKLEKFETYFENFTIDNKTINLQTEIGSTIKAMNYLDSQRYEIKTKLAKINQLQYQIKNGEHFIIKTDEATALPQDLLAGLEKLSTLINEKENLLASYKESTFAVKKKVQQLEYFSSRTLLTIDEYKKGLVESLSRLNEKRQTLERNFVSLPAKGTEFSKSKRFFSLYEGFYLSLMQKKAEYEIAKAGTVTDFVILASATLPGAPIYPQKLIVQGIGLVAGLFLSFMLIGVRYLLHNKISSQAEVEQLAMAPVLGSIPYYKKEKLPVTKMIINNNPKSAVNESLRTIRTNMEFLNAATKKKVISVTSTISGEGKTFVTVNLGGIISLSDTKVVILDLDLRKPKIHHAFGDENSAKGMSTILIQKHYWKECLRNTSLSNMDYIPAGPTPPNPSELMLSKELDKLLEELKQVYEVIIIDTPPVGLVTDGILVMRKTDLPIYVVRADYSKRDFSKTVNRLIRVNKFKNLAVVLNSLDTSNQNSYGYYEEASPKKSIFENLKDILSRKS